MPPSKKDYFEKKYKECMDEYNLVSSNDFINAHISKDKVYAVYLNKYNPENIFNGKLISINNYFKSDEYFMVKCNNEYMIFHNMYLDEIDKIFNKMNTIYDEYKILKKDDSNILILSGEKLCGAIAPLVGDFYEEQKKSYIKKIKNGVDFFELDISGSITSYEDEIYEFNWNKINSKEFVKLCRDIFANHASIIDAIIIDDVHDMGQDIELKENVIELSGNTIKKWCVQCKNFKKRKIAPSDIKNIIMHFPELHFDIYCLMTSNYLLPSTKRMIDSWNNDPAFPFKAIFWDRSKIEDYLCTNPELYKKYFKRVRLA